MMHTRLFRPCGVVVVVALAGQAAGDPGYTGRVVNPDEPVHANASGMTQGIAAADYDGDGDIDLFVATERGTPNRLYRNLGDGTFEEIGEAVGLGSTERQRAGVWVDVDSDGDLDLVVAGDNFKRHTPPTNQTSTWLFLQQADGTFVDATAGSGLDVLVVAPQDEHPNGVHLGGIAAGDLTGDGRPEIVVTFWNGPAAIYRNMGGGAFEDMTAFAGTDAFTTHWQPILHDFDGDGDTDMFCAVDFVDNKLYLNDGEGRMTDVASDVGIDNHFNDMGVAPGDFDNDGDIDLFISNIWEPIGIYAATHNVLFRNDMDADTPAFVEMSEGANVAYGSMGWGWGCTFTDADLDGDLDLAQTNGFYQRDFPSDRSRLFRNNGDATFSDVAPSWGFSDTDVAGGLVPADVDRDGDQDLVQVCMNGPVRVYLNQADGEGGWISVKPRTAGANTHGLGAVVRVTTTGGLTMTRLITAGTSMMSQEPAEAFFGLGGSSIASLRVEWPDGRSVTRVGADAAPGGVVTIMPHPAGGVAGYVSAFMAGNPEADRNGDGVFNNTDLHLFVREYLASGF